MVQRRKIRRAAKRSCRASGHGQHEQSGQRKDTVPASYHWRILSMVDSKEKTLLAELILCRALQTPHARPRAVTEIGRNRISGTKCAAAPSREALTASGSCRRERTKLLLFSLYSKEFRDSVPMKTALHVASICTAAIIASCCAAAESSFINFETAPVHPLALSPDRLILAVCNLPDGRVELFDISSGIPVHSGDVAVGI